jgi:biotin carboxyl carrier protein
MSRQFKVTVNGREYDVAVQEITPGAPSNGSSPAQVSGAAPLVSIPSAAPVLEARPATPSTGSGSEVVAQMGGVVIQIDVKVGQVVGQGDRVAVMEAMKMKTHVLATGPGQVSRIWVAAGDVIEAGQPLVSLA